MSDKIVIILNKFPDNYIYVMTVATLHTTHHMHSPYLNPLNAELNPICHLLALLGAHHILHVSGERVNNRQAYEINGCRW